MDSDTAVVKGRTNQATFFILSGGSIVRIIYKKKHIFRCWKEKSSI